MLLATVRCFVATFAPIPDCDETFNYWEPAHMMVYGRGMQTWEYRCEFALRLCAASHVVVALRCLRRLLLFKLRTSVWYCGCGVMNRSPEYMFRSYAYVGLHALVMEPLRLAGVYKPMAFFVVRGVLCFVSAACDGVLIHGAADRFGPGVGSFTLVAMLTAAGVVQASFAFLPSSFTMMLFSLCTGLWLGGNGPASVAAGAVGVLLGWPFAAVALAPVGLGLVWDALRPLLHRPSAWVKPAADVVALIVSGLVTTAAVLLVSLLVDIVFYGTVGLAVWEIIKYNALGMGGGGQGSDLYGVEPWWWYGANLALNFNAVAPVALLAPVALGCVLLAPPLCGGDRGAGGVASRLRALRERWDPAAAAAVSLALAGWFALMSSRAHKEERFMFPVYPMVAVCFGLAAETATQVLAGWGDPAGGAGAEAETGPKGSLEEAKPEAREAAAARARAEAGAALLNRRPRLLAAVTALALVASAAVSAMRVGGQAIMYGASLRAWAVVAQLTQARGEGGAPTAAVSSGVWRLLEAERERLGGADAVRATPLATEANTRTRRYGEHSDEPFGLRVCVGKEWYRFPGAMFLPDSTRAHGSAPGDWALEPADAAAVSGGPLVLSFLRSGFGGQLPQPFDVLGNRTSALLPRFNDANADEPDRYVPPTACDVIVDLELPEGEPEPWIADAKGARRTWKSVWSERFAHSDSTPQLARALWVPGWSEGRVSWATYHVLRRLTPSPLDGSKPLPTAGPAPSLVAELREIVKDIEREHGFEL